MDISGHKILVTGGTSGIGLALIEELKPHNNRFISCGRNPAKVQQLRKLHPEIDVFTCDLSKPEGRNLLVEWVRTKHPDINMLINNAGVAKRVSFVNDLKPASLEDIREQIETNLIAPLELTAQLTPLLKKNPRPTIVNVSSGLAYSPMAHSPIYCATKAALHSFSMSLRRQLEGQVQVIELLPPVVATPMTTEVNVEKWSAKDYAQAVVKQLRKGNVEIRVGATQILYLGARFSPQIADRILNGIKH